MTMKQRYTVKLNSPEKVEELLQEIYDDANRQMNLAQEEINNLKEATKLSEEPLDMKVKFGKAIHDYITDKEKAIGRKLDVSRLLSEILKSNGNVGKVLSDDEVFSKMDDEFKKIRESDNESEIESNDPKTETYITNRSK